MLINQTYLITIDYGDEKTGFYGKVTHIPENIVLYNKFHRDYKALEMILIDFVNNILKKTLEKAE